MEDYVCLLMFLGCYFQNGHATAERSSTVGIDPAQIQHKAFNDKGIYFSNEFILYHLISLLDLSAPPPPIFPLLFA